MCAMKLDAGEIGRQDLFGILPENVIVQESANGRAAPQSDEEIEALAASILARGQLQPVLVRRVEGNKVQLVAGYGRHRAVELINSRQETPIRLQCRVIDCNEEEAFVLNVSENNDRSATSPIDDAHNQRKLREQYGWEDSRIAEFYKKSVSHVLNLRKTLKLSTPIKKKIAAGELTVAAALDLAQLPEAEREATVAEATNGDGKVSGEKVRKKVRERKIEAGESKGRSLKELRTFFDEMAVEPGERDTVKALAEKVAQFISGKITDKQMTNALEKYCRA